MLLLLACTQPEDDTKTEDSGTEPGTETTPSPWEESFEAVREAAKKNVRQNRAYGAQVAIWYDGAIVFSEGFGYADEAETTAVSPTTLFQIGSDTKKMTAIAALQAVERGAMSLDSTVAEVLPDLSLARSPDWATSTTLHDLIDHQGGLYDYTPWDDDPDDAALEERALGVFAEEEWAMMPAGLAWNYANPNFSVAGLMTERVDGRPWADVVADDLFAPLGMTRSFARLEDALAAGELSWGNGYLLGEEWDYFDPLYPGSDYYFGAVAPEDQIDNAFVRPAGMVWSTAEDQCRLGAFLLDGDPAVLADVGPISVGYGELYPGVEQQQYGYGLMVLSGWQNGEEWVPSPLWTHGGNTLSMTSAFYVLPEQRIVVSVLSSGYGDDFSDTVVTALTGFDNLPAGEALPTLLEPETDLGRYAGAYADVGLGSLELSWDGTSLSASIPLLEEAGYEVGPVEAYALDMIEVEVAGYPYLFSAYGADGAHAETPSYLVNRQFVFSR